MLEKSNHKTPLLRRGLGVAGINSSLNDSISEGRTLQIMHTLLLYRPRCPECWLLRMRSLLHRGYHSIVFLLQVGEGRLSIGASFRSLESSHDGTHEDNEGMIAALPQPKQQLQYVDVVCVRCPRFEIAIEYRLRIFCV